MPNETTPPQQPDNDQDMQRFRPWLSRPERRVLALLGSAHGYHRQVPRVIPALFVASLAAWLLASPALFAALTPWTGAAALLAAGTYLARVVVATGRASLEAAHDGGILDQASVRRVRSAMFQALIMAAGTILLAIGFLLISLRVLDGEVPAQVPGLLWALCLGGFFLSLFVGELVMGLAETLERSRHRR